METVKVKKLTSKEMLFVQSYLAHGNGAEAYRFAGYQGNKKTMYANTWKLLQRGHIREAIEKGKKEKFDNAYAYLKGSQLKVSEHLVKIALSGIDAVSVSAAKDILKDVLVERKELLNINSTPRSKESILQDLKTLLGALPSSYIEREKEELKTVETLTPLESEPDNGNISSPETDKISTDLLSLALDKNSIDSPDKISTEVLGVS